MLVAMALASLFFSACGKGNSTPPVTYIIGGTVSNLSGTQLVLQDNGGDNLVVNANGSFHFATVLASGSNYSVTVLTKPPTLLRPARWPTVVERQWPT